MFIQNSTSRLVTVSPLDHFQFFSVTVTVLSPLLKHGRVADAVVIVHGRAVVISEPVKRPVHE